MAVSSRPRRPNTRNATGGSHVTLRSDRSTFHQQRAGDPRRDRPALAATSIAQRAAGDSQGTGTVPYWIVASRTRCKEQHALRTVPGIGVILGLTIALETGDITRFASVGDYASYCRMVKSERISNGKKKGHGNRKCGNRYLAWAWIEAANFALRFSPPIRRWYDRKCSKRHKVIAIKAVAHKLARAGYSLLRDGATFNVARAFG
ncbi:transposase [Dokdonella soli]|uniref:transposase n=1 Tax=Dokdonella soli TaxID=529810 RepID=UPI0031D057F7